MRLVGGRVRRSPYRGRIAVPPSEVFALLCDPAGHAAIDSTGMLQSAEGEPVTTVGDTFLDREALGDLPMGRYDVTVVITALEPDTRVEWTISGTVQPPIEHRYGYTLAPERRGTLVTSNHDWSRILERYRDRGFPVLPESALRATLGILARTLEQRGD